MESIIVACITGVVTLVGVILSGVLLVAALFACKALEADAVLPFGLAEVAVLLVSIVAYTCALVRKGR